MGRAITVPLALVALSAAGLLGCPGGQGRADLTPAPVFDSPGPEGFCKRVDGSLEVAVRNLGLSPTATAVAVDFPHGPATASVVTPEIPDGEVRTVLVPIPTPIPPGDFSFVIRVDPQNQVPEASEDNNTAEGLCIT